MNRVARLSLRTAALLVGGALLGTAVNAARRGGLEPTQFAAATSCEVPRAPETGGLGAIDVVPPTHAAHLCGDPGVLVADARSAEAFERGHVAGAIHLPCAASGDVVTRALGATADKHTLVVYGGDTNDARTVATSLRARLPRADLRMMVLSGGFEAWSAAGLACSSGPCPDCREQVRGERGAGGAPAAGRDEGRGAR